MNGCTNAGRPGCRSPLCRGAHSHLRRLTVLRYPVDENGHPDYSAAPAMGWVCALTGGARASGNTSIAIPGSIGTDCQLSLTAAAGSFTPPLAAGDHAEVNGARWQIYSVSGPGPFTACLAPAEES